MNFYEAGHQTDPGSTTDEVESQSDEAESRSDSNADAAEMDNDSRFTTEASHMESMDEVEAHSDSDFTTGDVDNQSDFDAESDISFDIPDAVDSTAPIGNIQPLFIPHGMPELNFLTDTSSVMYERRVK